MKNIAAFVLVLILSAAVRTQSPEPPLADTRLTVHTLVREDVFAGFLQGDMTRLARAEKNLEALLAGRPDDRAALLAWQGATALTRAAIAHQANQSEEFQQHHRRAIDLFEEAMRVGPNDVGVFAITGGTHVSVADRLPVAERAAGWQLAYTAYQRLWQLQGNVIDKLPLHHKGEVLAGLAQSAQRTGRTGEVGQQLDRILAYAPDSIYARRAQEWKDNPESMTQSRLTCQTCHAPGMLVARIAEVSKEPR